MKNKDLQANSIALVITIVSIILLIAGIVFSITTKVSDDEVTDMELKAQNLIAANFDTVSYFKIASLNAVDGYKAEDYPEGAVPCNANVFASYDELADFINNTYVPTTAALLLNTEVNGTKRYFDYNAQLCMAVVKPNTSYDKDWSNIKFKLTDIKKKSANIAVTVNIKDSDKTATIKLRMVKYEDKWLLENLEY